MIRLLLPFFISCLACSSSSDAAVSFRDGEHFTFRVSWGLFSQAGAIDIIARAEEVSGLSQIRLITTTSTQGVVRRLFSFDGRAESVFDGNDGRMLAATATTQSRKRRTHAMAVFDYTSAQVHYRDYLRPQRSLSMPLPTGQPMDLITSLIEARAWNLQPGEKRPTTVMFDDEFYELILVAERIETIKTPDGTPHEALLIVPTMEKEPKGLFRRGGSVRVWISRDERRLPLKLDVSTRYGTGTAWLTHYQPPTASTMATR